MYMRENRFSSAKMKRRPIRRRQEYSLESITQHEEEEEEYVEDFSEEEELEEEEKFELDFNNPKFRKQVFTRKFN